MNIVANVICEVLSEALRGKNRVTPTTITAIAEVCVFIVQLGGSEDNTELLE